MLTYSEWKRTSQGKAVNIPLRIDTSADILIMFCFFFVGLSACNLFVRPHLIIGEQWASLVTSFSGYGIGTALYFLFRHVCHIIVKNRFRRCVYEILQYIPDTHVPDNTELTKPVVWIESGEQTIVAHRTFGRIFITYIKSQTVTCLDGQ